MNEHNKAYQYFKYNFSLLHWDFSILLAQKVNLVVIVLCDVEDNSISPTIGR